MANASAVIGSVRGTAALCQSCRDSSPEMKTLEGLLTQLELVLISAMDHISLNQGNAALRKLQDTLTSVSDYILQQDQYTVGEPGGGRPNPAYRELLYNLHEDLNRLRRSTHPTSQALWDDLIGDIVNFQQEDLSSAQHTASSLPHSDVRLDLLCNSEVNTVSTASQPWAQLPQQAEAARDVLLQLGQEVERVREELQRLAQENASLQLLLTESVLASASGAGHEFSSVIDSEPDEFRCPISGDIMEDPVLLVETGHTFERSFVQEWFRRGNRRCPLTSTMLPSTRFVPNWNLKKAIERWRALHPQWPEEAVDKIQHNVESRQRLATPHQAQSCPSHPSHEGQPPVPTALQPADAHSGISFPVVPPSVPIPLCPYRRGPETAPAAGSYVFPDLDMDSDDSGEYYFATSTRRGNGHAPDSPSSSSRRAAAARRSTSDAAPPSPSSRRAAAARRSTSDADPPNSSNSQAAASTFHGFHTVPPNAISSRATAATRQGFDAAQVHHWLSTAADTPAQALRAISRNVGGSGRTHGSATTAASLGPDAADAVFWQANQTSQGMSNTRAPLSNIEQSDLAVAMAAGRTSHAGNGTAAGADRPSPNSDGLAASSSNADMYPLVVVSGLLTSRATLYPTVVYAAENAVSSFPAAGTRRHSPSVGELPGRGSLRRIPEPRPAQSQQQVGQGGRIVQWIKRLYATRSHSDGVAAVPVQPVLNAEGGVPPVPVQPVNAADAVLQQPARDATPFRCEEVRARRRNAGSALSRRLGPDADEADYWHRLHYRPPYSV